jgi:hypothetical protein
MILYDFCLLHAWFCYVIVNVRNLESHMHCWHYGECSSDGVTVLSSVAIMFKGILTLYSRLHNIYRACLHWNVLATAKLWIFTSVYFSLLTNAGIQLVVFQHRDRVQISAHYPDLGVLWFSSQLPRHCQCLITNPLYLTFHGSSHNVAWSTDIVVK